MFICVPKAGPDYSEANSFGCNLYFTKEADVFNRNLTVIVLVRIHLRESKFAVTHMYDQMLALGFLSTAVFSVTKFGRFQDL